MNVIVWVVIILIFVLLGAYVVNRTKTKEHFAAPPDSGIEEKIIYMYKDILQREPTASELIGTTRDINRGMLTMEGLHQKLLDSDEYARLIKLQSNSLTPELQKMLSDRSLIRRIYAIYLEEKNKNVPSDMVLPLKDVYIWLNYNEYAFRAFLRSEKYAYFEDDAMRTTQLDKEDLMDMLKQSSFDKTELEKQGMEIAKEIAAKEESSAKASCPDQLVGASPCEKVVRTPNDTDSDMTPMLDGIVSGANQVFNKDEVAKMLDERIMELQLPVRTHKGDMVLREDQSWTVPYRPPPVCTTLGQKPLVQPVMTDSKLLLGTTLTDASNTQTGSIMPKFEYKEYVPILIGDAVQGAKPV